MKKQTIKKKLSSNVNVIGVIILSFLFSCEDNHNHRMNEYDSQECNKLKLPERFITNKFLNTSISVIEAKELNVPNTQLVINGFIGGLRNPFATNRATFVLGDNSLQTCDQIPDDHCPTPWDVCCEDRNKVILGTLSVQFVDENGTVLRGNIENIHGLRPGIEIQVQGIVATESLPQAMLINVSKFKINN